MTQPDEPRDEELAERVAELETTLEELRDELRRPPRGPLGLPRPPTPRELLRFADEYAIPTAIAALEATIRTLELVQGVFRLLSEGDRAGRRSRAARDRAAELGRESLGRLDEALSELQAALEDADLPENPQARDVLEDARALNAEIREALGDAGGRSAEGRYEATPDDDAEDDPLEPEDAVEIDIDAELESIRDELDRPDGAGDGDDADDGPDGNGEGDEDGGPDGRTGGSSG